jgi:hypothetical protein
MTSLIAASNTSYSPHEPEGMMVESGRQGCDIVGCDKPAPGHYLDARDGRHLQFRLCQRHFDRLGHGERPVVVAERLDLPELDGRLALVLQ